MSPFMGDSHVISLFDESINRSIDDDDDDDDHDDQVTIRPIIMLGSILTDFAMTCARPAFTSWYNDEHRAPTSYHRYLYSRVADAIYN